MVGEEMASHTTIPTQGYNHPCGDLLDGERRRDYLNIAIPLYSASIRGDLEVAKVILRDRERFVRYSITEKKETPLHVAATGHSTEFVRYLVNMMNMVDLELQNTDGNTAFCLAAISGNIGMVKIMFDRNQALPIICGSENMMPLYLAAYHGNRDVVNFLYDKSDKMMGSDWTYDNRNGVLLKCIQSNLFDVALRIMKDNEELPHDKYLWDVLQELARKSEAFQLNVGEMITPSFAPFYLVKMHFSKRRNATELLRLLWKRIMEKPKDFIDKILRGPVLKEYNMETYPSQILYIAAKMNNKPFLFELIREYPDLIWKRNDDGQTIFHVAVAHRHHETFSLLYEIGSVMYLLAPITDHQGNNILHLAGNKQQKIDSEDWTAPTLQMYSEIFWYQEVERILPPPCREVKNAEGQTPHELFLESHKKLVLEGLKSINDTINLCMVVAALVCTIGFSVVYQIPGGFNQSNGFPMFVHNKYFLGFVQADVLSFICSSSSMILFLSITLYYHHGTMKFLLKRWVLAQLLLLHSVLFLVLEFSLSFLILYRRTMWVYVCCVLTFITTGSFTLICIFCVIDAVRATYGRPRPKNGVIYPKAQSSKRICYD